MSVELAKRRDERVGGLATQTGTSPIYELKNKTNTKEWI